jgi:hypothetical protein
MDAPTLRSYLEKLDAALRNPAACCVFGSAACMLLGEEGRISLDVDVAASYSTVDETEFRAAAAHVGLPVNPPADFAGDHIEWIGPLRLCLANPQSAERVNLWQGSRLTIFTVGPADLVASKLIRYDPSDQADIQFLMVNGRLRFDDVVRAVERLPAAFRQDALVLENLANLKRDCQRWIG